MNSVYSFLKGLPISKGTTIGLSGWSPCSYCSDGKSHHLHLEFRTSGSSVSPYGLTPYSANGISIDGYQAWSITLASNSQIAFNYQGTLTRGSVVRKAITWCNQSAYEWDSVYGYTWHAIDTTALTSTNHARTVVSISVSMPGIGNTSGNNNNPLHPQRNLDVRLINGYTNQQVAAKVWTATYSRTTGLYSMIVDMGSVATGAYFLRARMSNTLFKQAQGFFSIDSRGTTINVVNLPLVSGDINADNRLDVFDYNLLIGCYGSKINTSSCLNPSGSNLNDDSHNGQNVVDGADYNLWLREVITQQ